MPPAAIHFRPHRLLRGGHAQTLAGAWLPRRRRPYLARPWQVVLDDGDQIVLHDDCPDTWRAGDPVALLVHGLCGSHQSPYMVRVAAKWNARGRRVFRMDMRGCGAAETLASKPGHAGRSEDVRAAVQWIAEHCPESPLALVGFSLGGNLVLKYLGELGDDTAACVQQAVAVSPPIDLIRCSQYVQRGIRALYARKFVRQLVAQLQRRKQHVAELADVCIDPTPSTLYEFDDRFTAPLSGFRNAGDYYQRSSSAVTLHRIARPTWILAADDDPLIPGQIFRDTKLSSQIQVTITSSGGHLGYIARSGRDPDRHWMDWRILEHVG